MRAGDATIQLGNGPAIPYDEFERKVDHITKRAAPERFTKIKFNGEEVTLNWITVRTKSDGKTEAVQHTLTSKDTPAPPLIDALLALHRPVIELLELPNFYLNGFRVIGVSLNYEDGDDRMGVVITSLKDLEATNAPLVLNTPHLREASGEDDGSLCMPDAWYELLAELSRAASDYIRGIRAQGDLFAK